MSFFQLLTAPTAIVALLDRVSPAIQVSMVNSAMKLVLHHAKTTSVIAARESVTTALGNRTDGTVVLQDFTATCVMKFVPVPALVVFYLNFNTLVGNIVLRAFQVIIIRTVHLAQVSAFQAIVILIAGVVLLGARKATMVNFANINVQDIVVLIIVQLITVIV